MPAPATELLTSELILELADLSRASLTKTSDVRARVDQLLAEIDRRIPIATYVRDPTPTEVGELVRLGAESIKPNVRRDARIVRAKRRR